MPAGQPAHLVRDIVREESDLRAILSAYTCMLTGSSDLATAAVDTAARPPNKDSLKTPRRLAAKDPEEYGRPVFAKFIVPTNFWIFNTYYVIVASVK